MTRADVEPELVDLIGAVYDAAIDPKLWWPVLDRIRLHFGFHMAALGVTALPTGEAVLQVTANMPPEYAGAIPKYGEAAVAIWGGPQRASQLPLEEPLLLTQATRREDWIDNAFYLEWARPQGIVDQVALFLARDSTMLGSLGLSVHESSAGPTEEDMQKLRLLAPHIRRSVTISRLLERSAEIADTFAAALEASRTAILIVEDDLRIRFANASAEAMLQAGDPVRRVSGQLSLRNELQPGQLRAAIKLADGDEGRLGRRGIGLPARLADGTVLALHVMPLKRRSRDSGFGPSASAAIFIAETGRAPSLPTEALSLLYGLTPAETRAFELIVEGHSTAEVAYKLAVAPSTLRSHLLAVFAKTGRRNRADLVRLAHEIALPG